MRVPKTFLPLCCAASVAVATPMPAQDNAEPTPPPRSSTALLDYRWEHRLLLLFTPSLQDEAFTEYMADLERTAKAWEERDVLIGMLPEGQAGRIGSDAIDAATVAEIYEDFEVRAGKLTTVLVGKDGTEKLHLQTAASPAYVIGLIDSMPMRQREMAEQRAVNDDDPGTSKGHPRTYEAMAKAYLDAHDRKDMLAALKLVYFRGAPPFIRQQMVRSLEEDFRQPVARVSIEPPGEDQIRRYEYRGVEYTTTLPVSARMIIEFEQPEADVSADDTPGDVSPFARTTYPLGGRNGRIFIVTARPADPVEAK
jgi:hypothetical protein